MSRPRRHPRPLDPSVPYSLGLNRPAFHAAAT
jgi:hypothetical protein